MMRKYRIYKFMGGYLWIGAVKWWKFGWCKNGTAAALWSNHNGNTHIRNFLIIALALSLGGCKLGSSGQSVEQITHGCRSMFPGDSEYNACLYGALLASCSVPQVQDFKPCHAYIQKMEGITRD